MEKTVKNKWDGFWDNYQAKSVNVMNVEIDTWYKLVWQYSLNFWSDVFNKYSQGKSMLECGAGSAKLSLFMSTQGYNCTMLDYSFSGLKLGIDNFNKCNLKGNFIVGDTLKLPFKDDSFHVITSGGLLEHFRDVEQPIEEMIRVIKPGGVFSATIIPAKFSCQKLADIEVFICKLLYNIFNLKFKDCIKSSRRNFPFYENSIPLKEYKRICEKYGVRILFAKGVSPFPSLAMPKPVEKLYVGLMKIMMPVWKWFDASGSRFSEFWGAAFVVYGIKTEKSSSG